MEAPDARDLVLGVFDQGSVGRLLRLEDSVDTLGGNDGLILVGVLTEAPLEAPGLD